ncbi:SAF domain-containing protein [Phycicoccus sonneratiae]|nr:SAF domain-containing protein [Phycicoccus sonneraticus]
MAIDTARVNGAVQERAGSAAPAREAAVAPPPKLRRRPMLVAASIAAICLGALLAAFAWSATSTTRSVLAVRVPVERGALIESSDVVAVQVSTDPALDPVPASQSDTVVGQRAAVDIAAGTLLTRAQVTTAVVPPAGFSMVGVGLPAASMPGEPLLAGDKVRIVATPGEQGEVTTQDAPATIDATVVGVRVNDENGQNVVSVLVPTDDAPELAARAATGKVALVLDSRER